MTLLEDSPPGGPAAERSVSWRAIALGLALGLTLPPLLFASFLIAAQAVASAAEAGDATATASGRPLVLAYGGDAPAATPQTPRRQVVVAGSIAGSLTDAATVRGVPPAVLSQVYRVLAHAVDLQRDLRPGDTFRLGYEEAGESGETRLLFLWLHLRDRTLAVYRHTTADGFTGYFDRDGRSAERPLLQTPVDGGRLSSGFGMRFHPILGYSRLHRGLDFAAPMGTPVYAAGDGVVVKRDTYGGYGRYVRVDHGAAEATAYGHLSAYADGLEVGDTVRQGQEIGYVGASGLATGPHLHYEVMLDGERVDPVAVALPPRRVLSGDDIARFRVERIRMMVALQRGGAFDTDDAPGDAQSAALP